MVGYMGKLETNYVVIIFTPNLKLICGSFIDILTPKYINVKQPCLNDRNIIFIYGVWCYESIQVSRHVLKYWWESMTQL